MKDTMKAVVYQKKGALALEERPIPKLLHPKDAIVRVTMAAICSSDLHIRRGAVPRAREGVILGHEIVGEVADVGSGVTKLQKGDRVAVNCETFCGECFFCRRGLVNNCAMEEGGWALGCRIDGGQTEYVRVPWADNGLEKIPAGVSDDAALLVGDVLSTGYWAAEIAELRPAETVAVIGAGPTGLCTAMCAALYSPANVVMIDISSERLDFAKKLGLANVTVNPREEDPQAAVRALTRGRGADKVFEAAGGEGTFEMAWKLARCSGTVCVVAMYEETQALPLQDMYGKNLTFKTGGVHANACGRILELIAGGKLDTRPLITHRFPLEEALEGYRLFEAQEDQVIKAALTPGVLSGRRCAKGKREALCLP